MKKIATLLLIALLMCGIILLTSCDQGEQGPQGEQGVGIEKVEIVDGKLIITYTDGKIVNLGPIVVTSGTPGLEYYLLPDGTYGVKMGTTQYLEEIEIPNLYNNAPVTQILEEAFSDATSLKSIIIPNNVTSIGERAFGYCTSLTSIIIPDSITSIGERAFSECTDLTSITFEGTVSEWNAIEFGYNWNENVPATEVVCSDGTVKLK